MSAAVLDLSAQNTPVASPSSLRPAHVDKRSHQNREPAEYAAAILKYSSRAKESTLYPGIHYRPLAQLLTAQRPTYANSGASYAPRKQLRPHAYAVLHDLDIPAPGNPRRVVKFDNVNQLSEFVRGTNCEASSSNQLLFLRGFPPAEWINFIGSQYLVDPEFFRRHLNFLQRQDFHELPALPSSCQNIIQLSITSIGQYPAGVFKFGHRPEALLDYLQSLGKDQDVVGESIVRQFTIHNETHFSIEQQISICIVRRKIGWTAIILCDHGRALDEGPRGPWSPLLAQISKLHAVFDPIIQFTPKIALKEPSRTQLDEHQNPLSFDSSLFQSVFLLLSECYGRLLSCQHMSSSPFYALHEIFAFYIASENQFCNYLFTRLKIDTDQCTRQPVAMQRALKVLGLHKTILQAHIGQLTNMIKLLRNKETAPWVRLESAENIGMLPQVQPHLSRQNSGVHERPSQPTDPRKDATLERAASDLLVDYEEVLQRETTLLQSYDNSMNEIRNLAMLLEAQRGIEQAEGVARLTLLAFLFIPLSFTSSFFGMNFKEFVGDGLSLWVWFAVSIPIFLVSLGVCFADKLQQTWRITIGDLRERFLRW